MKLSPEIRWLIDRWGLPGEESVTGIVKDLLESERTKGSTALQLPSPVTDWGRAASAAGDPGTSPLVRIGHGGAEYLQSRRCYLAEESIATRILGIAGAHPLPPPGAGLESFLKSLFPHAAEGDLQLKAARTAWEQRLLILTGGPGTGKTFTLSRILSLLIECGISADFIRLAAPTGKAADRMKQSVEQSFSTAGEEDDSQRRKDLLRIARGSSTIHSLLGYNPSKGRCRHDAKTPLSCEVLILDECSMVDLHLFRALLEALPADARLILLGDPLQLQSVAQGNVLGDLVSHAADPASPLHSCHIHLTESQRFKDRKGIKALAQALESSDADAAEALLLAAQGASEDGVAWIKPERGRIPYKAFPETVRRAVEAVASARDGQTALDLLGSVCILTAHRNHSLGAKAIGERITRELKSHGIGPAKGQPPNVPVIVNENDPETGLRNGAVGILHTVNDGVRRAYFPGPDKEPTPYPVGALPDHSPAWAITIHRSQGSEYDDVLVILPSGESPLTTRELLYTAITRARRNVHIAGSLDIVKTAVKTRSDRVTLLKAALDRVARP